MNIKKTALATAVSAAIGVPAGAAVADTITLDWSGAMTMFEPSGTSTLYSVADDANVAPYWGYRTAVSGTMFFDLDSGTGSATINPYQWYGNQPSENLITTSVSLQAIGNGFGGEGSLILGNMGFNWGGNNGVPVSIVWDAAGLFGYLDGLDPNASPTDGATSDTLSGFGATAASDGENTWVTGNPATFSLPMGPSPMVTTAWNTTAIGTVTLGTNPSGTLPLVADTSPGNPMATAPFPNHMVNYDITVMHVTSYISSVPVPAAVWLFGSGLLGLLGVARRQRK